MSYKNLIRKVFVPMLALSLMPFGNTVSADMRGVLTNPAQTVIVGDSRTEGMYETVGDSGVLWEYKSGMGYNWMVNDAVPEIDPYVGDGTSVVIMLGVNDIGDSWMADQYAAFLNSKAAEWKGRGAKVYYIAVTKCADNYSDRWGTDNSHIAEWNERIRPQLSTDVIYLDISSILGEVETVDGLHYTNTTNQQIYNIVMNYVESARYSDMIGTLGTGAFIIDQSENVPGVTGNGEMNEDGSIAGVTGSNENDVVDGVIGSNPNDEDKKEDSSDPDSSEVQTLIPEVLEHSEDIDQESVHPGVTGNNDNLLEEWFEEHPIEFGSESVVETVIPEEDYGELPPLDNEENANKIDEESKDTTESDSNIVFEDGGWTDIEKDNDAEQNLEGTVTEENPVEERNIGSFADSLVESVVEEPILIPEDTTDSVAESMIEEPEDPSVPEYMEDTDSELTIPEQDENAEPVSPENVKESADEAKDRADREIREGGAISNVDDDKFNVNGAMLAPGSVTAADW